MVTFSVKIQIVFDAQCRDVFSVSDGDADAVHIGHVCYQLRGRALCPLRQEQMLQSTGDIICNAVNKCVNL